jgi:hypothetical protein
LHDVIHVIHIASFSKLAARFTSTYTLNGQILVFDSFGLQESGLRY